MSESPVPAATPATGVPWGGVLLLFFLALVPRCVAVQQYEANHPDAAAPVIDERSYDRWASEIAAGDWVGSEVFFQEPLYPYFLGTVYAIWSDSPREASRIVQCLLGALACVFTALLARELSGNLAGWLAGGSLALLQVACMFPAYLLKPNLFLPLLAATAWGLVRTLRRTSEGELRGRAWLWLGVAFGLGALLRGNMLLLVPGLVILAWLEGRRAGQGPRPVLLAAGGVLLVLLPVAFRNLAVGDVFALTTSGAGTNLYGGNNLDNPFGVAREFDWVRGIPEYEADDWRREAERRSGTELDASEVSRYWMSEVFDSVSESPGAHVTILLNKLLATLSDYEVPDNHDLAFDSRHVPLLRAPLLTWGILGPLILAGVLLALVQPRSREERWLAWVFLAYLATIVLTVTSMRVRLALVPLGLPLAAGFLVRLRHELRGRSLALALGFLAIGVIAVHALGPFDAAERERRLDAREYNALTYRIERGQDLEETRRLAMELRTRRPDSARVQSLCAEIEARTGLALCSPERTEAEQAEGRARIRASLEGLRELASAPALSSKERFRVRRLAGWIQLTLSNGRAAANHFRAALEFDADDPELWLGWIQAQLLVLEAGTSAEAVELRGAILDAIDEHLDPALPAAQDLRRRASAPR